MGTVAKMRRENDSFHYRMIALERAYQFKIAEIERTGFWTRVKWVFKGVKV